MGIGSHVSSPWQVVIGSVQEVVDFMGTGSISPANIMSMMSTVPAVGSVAVVYYR